jgi:hypothetical protein
VALLLIAIPLADNLASIWPLRPGEASWRYGATGLASAAIMMPILGLLLAIFAAVIMSHRRAVVTLSVVAFVGAVAGLAALGVFTMDMLQMRPRIRPEAVAGFDRTNIIAVVKYLAGTAVTVAIGLGGLAAARGMHPASRGKGAPIVAGKDSMEKPGMLIGGS